MVGGCGSEGHHRSSYSLRPLEVCSPFNLHLVEADLVSSKSIVETCQHFAW